MIFDPTWLSTEAEKIHIILLDTALGIAGILILVCIICDYFRLSFFSFVPVASDLVSRLFIAFLLLYFYADIADALSNFTDALVWKIGKLNDIEHVLTRMGEKLHTLSWNWTSIKDTTILLICFGTFFLLYISVFIMNAGVIYVWLLLYLLSPILIILYLTPATEGATKVLFRSLVEVCCWKIMWGISAALLWSSALGSMNSTEELNFLTIISFNLILALSLLATPILVNIVASSGLASLAAQSVSTLTNAATNNLPQMAKSTATGAKQTLTQMNQKRGRK
jgi:hypothetical protein